MIVKVQIPLETTTEDPPPAMVYNEDRSFEVFMEITDELLEGGVGNIGILTDVSVAR